MTTTIELLDAAKVAAGCTSDYQLAKRMGLTVQTISTWRRGKSTFDDTNAAKIAAILGREPCEVMALCAAERSKDAGNRARWLRAAALLAAAVLPPAAGASVDNNGALSRLLPVQTTDYAQFNVGESAENTAIPGSAYSTAPTPRR